ncbi:UNVERIFIED_CONTAM: hypothetical protein GTU68_023337 [Idotea baltica]|nr:hypothetical protein [Idotea baltica]
MSTYAVGDIQGCYDVLSRGLERINFDHSKDVLLCVGDLVNRGPDSLKVVNLLKSLNNQCVTVLGNHDIHLLSMIYGIRTPKYLDSVDDILGCSQKQDIADWFRQKPLMVVNEEQRFVMSHAGIYPWWTLKQASKRAKEVEALLKDETSCIKLLKKVYGNTPNMWDKNLRKTARYRFIMNAFTRMRFCGSGGRLNLDESGYSGKIRKNRIPWFKVENTTLADYRVIFGHWSALGFLNTGNHLGLDTGCVWGRHMTFAKIPKKPNTLKPIKKANLTIVPNL